MRINTTLSKNKDGFTIVELLIVIVVIAILAAITIVAFNGVTARANTSSAQSAASTVVKKIEAYHAENAEYPTESQLTDTESNGKSWNASGILFDLESDKPSSPNTVTTSPCQPVVPGPVTGTSVSYWNYETDSLVTIKTGNCPDEQQIL